MPSRRPPWERENPKPASEHTQLNAESKAAARRRAADAGRPYPNLVDNMQAAREQKARRPAGGRSSPRGRRGDRAG